MNNHVSHNFTLVKKESQHGRDGYYFFRRFFYSGAQYAPGFIVWQVCLITSAYYQLARMRSRTSAEL